MHNYTIIGIIVAGLGSLIGLYFIHLGNSLNNQEKNDLLSKQLDNQSKQLVSQEKTIKNLETNNEGLIQDAQKLQDNNVELLEQNFELLNSNQGIQNSNSELFVQNRSLTSKIDKYQDEIREKDARIKLLEEKAKKVSRGNISTIQFDGSYLVRRGGSLSVTGGTDEAKIYQQLSDLEKQKKFSEMITLAENQITSNSDWLTPYLFKALALLNTGKKEEAMNLLEYVENQAPSDHQYTLALMQLYISLGNQNKANQLLNTLPKEVQVDIQNQIKRNNNK